MALNRNNKPTNTLEERKKNILGVFSLILLKNFVWWFHELVVPCVIGLGSVRKAPTAILHTDVRIYQELLSIVKLESVHRLDVCRSIRLVVVVVSGFR